MKPRRVSQGQATGDEREHTLLIFLLMKWVKDEISN